MASSRDDFVIAIRSAFLKKSYQQKFSLLTLIFLSFIIIILGSFNFKATQYVKIGIKEVEFEDLEYKRLADLMVKPNIQMANDGLFSLELFERIRGYIEDYRKMQ